MTLQHDDPLRRHLAGLSNPTPRSDLFGRIERSRVQRRRRRQWVRGVSVAAAVLLAALLPLRAPMAPAPDAATAVVTDAAALQPDPDEAALRRIDRQLQAAYDRGADADTLHTLWLARERAAVHTRIPEHADDSVISL